MFVFRAVVWTVFERACGYCIGDITRNHDLVPMAAGEALQNLSLGLSVFSDWNCDLHLYLVACIIPHQETRRYLLERYVLFVGRAEDERGLKKGLCLRHSRVRRWAMFSTESMLEKIFDIAGQVDYFFAY